MQRVDCSEYIVPSSKGETRFEPGVSFLTSLIGLPDPHPQLAPKGDVMTIPGSDVITSPVSLGDSLASGQTVAKNCSFVQRLEYH